VNPKIYYKLENFYANHRNFVKSRNYKQLRGNDLTAAELGTTCDPVLKMSDLGDKIPKISLNKPHGWPFGLGSPFSYWSCLSIFLAMA
jgi:hypothetical protein